MNASETGECMAGCARVAFVSIPDPRQPLTSVSALLGLFRSSGFRGSLVIRTNRVTECNAETRQRET